MPILRQRWPLFAALLIAAVALVESHRPGGLIGYFRAQAPAPELFTPVLSLIFLMPPLCARLRLPAFPGRWAPGPARRGPKGHWITNPSGAWNGASIAMAGNHRAIAMPRLMLMSCIPHRALLVWALR